MEDIDAHQDREAQLTRIAQRVSEIAQHELGTEGFMLLSRLGQELGTDITIMKALTKKRLIDFVKDYLHDRFKVIEIPSGSRLVYALVNLDVDSRTFSERAAEQKSPKVFRYHPRLWAAFSVPPSGGGHRYLDLSTLIFREIDEGGAAPEGARLIPDTLIPATDAQDRKATIQRNIEIWLAQSGLDRTKFGAGSRPPPPEYGHSQQDRRPSILELIISSLDQRQLREVTLPLDVIARLLRNVS